MKKTLTLTLTFLTIFGGAFAGNVTVETAKTVAVNFISPKVTQNQRSAVNATLQFTSTQSNGAADFYIFNISPKGFVIVSADDHVTPILAYSTENSFNQANNSSAVKVWMDHAATHIRSVAQRANVVNAAIQGLWVAYSHGPVSAGAKENKGVAPMLKTNWGQEPNYNQYCPFNTVDNQRCVTGCVATAMAQIMKYWNYPAQGTGSYSYNNAQPAYSHNYGVQSANFGATTYLWDSMPAQVTGPNDAVATLMRHCGVAVAMNYGDDNQGGSGAYVLQSEVPSWKPCAQSAYVNYFNYNPSSIQGIRESDYTPEGWLAVIEHELNEGRPVQYEGLDIYYGGHTWVCDGYDANDFLHMNWGWDGESNGYFAVTSLAADGYDFSYEEAALIGIEPIVNITVTASASALQVCAGQPTTLTAVGSASATYSWEPATGLSCPTCAVTTANPTASTVYTVTMDSAGFTTTSSITVMVRRAITAVNFDTINNVTCNGAGNGSLTVSVQGGTPSYAYMWSNGETSSSISSLSGGTYSLTVTDASGCSFFVSQTISEPTTLSVSVTAFNAGCNNIYGNITSNVTGGSGNFSFNWSNGETTAIGTQMPAGSYTLTVTDDNGCSASASATVAIPAPLQVSVSANDATTGDNGSVSVDNVAQGIGPYAYLWSNGDTTSFVGNVAPGAYTVTVTDVNGCQQTATAQVDGAVATAINQTGNTVNTSVYPNPAKNNVTVNLGKINGQTSISLINSLGQTIKTMNISDVQTNIDLSQVADGIYFIQVKQGQNTSTTQLVVRK